MAVEGPGLRVNGSTYEVLRNVLKCYSPFIKDSKRIFANCVKNC